MWAPSLRAFFYCGPLVLQPVRDGGLVALNRSALWHLTAPPTRVQDAPQMARVVPHPELLTNHRRHPPQRPQLVGKPTGQCASAEERLKLLALFGGQLLGPPRRGLGSERPVAVLLPIVNPAVHSSR